MKKLRALNRRTLALAAVLVPLAALLAYVATRAGPLAPVPVTVTTVREEPLTPALYGIGTVAARYTYRIGPTLAGRVARVEVQVGDRVDAGQLLGEMEPVDLDERVDAQEAARKRAQASVLAAEAQLADAAARKSFADGQLRRYERLLTARAVSQEAVDIRRQELEVTEAGWRSAGANLEAAHQELARLRSEREAQQRQRGNMRLVAPVAGLVTNRAADPGTTVVAGQAVVEMIDPASVWIHVRFDQLQSAGLRAGLPAAIVLRSRAGQALAGRVLRVEPLADAVTEETLAKVVLDAAPEPLPPIGELAEVTVALPELPPRPVVPNASVQRVDGRLGVWVLEDGSPRFAPVHFGAADLEGRLQVLEGLRPGDMVVVHSQRALEPRSRVEVVERVPGAAT